MPALSTRRPLQWSQYPLQCAPSRRRTARSHYNALSLCPRFNGSPGARIAVPLAPIMSHYNALSRSTTTIQGLFWTGTRIAVPLAPLQCEPSRRTARSHYTMCSHYNHDSRALLEPELPYRSLALQYGLIRNGPPARPQNSPRSDTHYHGIQRYVCDFTGSITCHHLPAAKSPQNGSQPTHTPQALVVMRLQLTTNRHGYKLQSTHSQQLL
jgi:hypothetical protein